MSLYPNRPTGSSAGRSLPSWLYLAALAIVTVISRLPQLLSRNLLLEGDECILGLMGMHVAQGREFPIFFYGQKYGLSIVEAPAAALSFILFGSGAVPLKIAILAIWIGGIAFYFLAFAHVMGKARSFWITLLLVLMPAWAATSMKAWSGYITAFSATGATLYVMTRNDATTVRWLIAGGLTGIIYYAQPLWLPSLAPIILYFLWSNRGRISGIGAYVCGVGFATLPVLAARTLWSAGVVETWLGPPIGNPHPLLSVPRLLNQTYLDLTGSYYFGAVVHTGRFTTTAACIWLGILGVAALLQVYRVLTRKYLVWSHVLFASVSSTLIANWVMLEWRDPRYLLALNVPLVYLAGVEFFALIDGYRVPVRRWVTALIVLLALQAVSMSEFANYTDMWWSNAANSPSETKTLRKVIGYMRSRGVTHAFAMNALLQWTITFYSEETVLTRWKADRDRYPPYIRHVDRAVDRGETVAIVGYVGYTYGLERMVANPDAIVSIDGKYFIYVGAGKDLLRRAGFEFR
jgi:hypothetical protein